MPKKSSIATEFEPSGFFALRTPLLPFDEFTAWNDGLEAPSALTEGDDLDAALAHDRARLRERLATLVARPELADALYLASPSLHEHLATWLQEPEGERGQRIERALVAYFSRATSRATPFGLLAGCSVGTFGGSTRLALTARGGYRRHSRLDMDYLWTLAGALANDPQLRQALVYRPNSSSYRFAERLRYAEATLVDGVRTYRLVAVEETPYLLATLQRAAAGATLGDLARGLMDDEVALDEAEEYVGELIEAQILVPDIYPQVTGDEPVHAMVARLGGHPATASTAAVLEDTLLALEAIDGGGVGVAPEAYRDLAQGLDALPAAPEPARLVQVELVKPAPGASLPASVAGEMLRAVELLLQLRSRAAPDPLRRFRDRFVERYGGREIRLVEALDEEDGVGFFAGSRHPGDDASPLLEGLDFPAAAVEGPAWAPRDTLLLRHLSEALRKGHREITPEANEFADTHEGNVEPPLPDAFDVMATIVAASAEAVDRGDFRLLVRGATGPSGARLLGRFCHADEQLHNCVASHLRDEERLRPDVVFAEIVHQPEGRIGNILARPVLRDHEIVFLGRSGAAEESQLPITDLLVSVRDDRVVLRSMRLDREVAPRLTTAHNYSGRGLGPYRFLCALQHQQVVGGLAWSWGPLSGAPYLPRVRIGRVVLSRAMWNLHADELTSLATQHGRALYGVVQAMRDEHAWPRHVVLADADNALLFDLDNILCVEALATRLKRRPRATLMELLPGPEELVAEGPEGFFTHELVVPFGRKPAPTAPAQPAKSHTSSQRGFPPGSGWLYAKLYASASAADRLLVDLVSPLVHAARTHVDDWFYVRFADPEDHIRLRFRGDPSALMARVLPAVQQMAAQAIDSGIVWRLQLDTYEPEVARYGGERGIALAEKLFSADSDAALAILARASGDAGLALRWRAALYGTDRLLDDLALDTREKHAWARTVRDGYVREFGADAALRRQIGALFRREGRDLTALLGPEAPETLDGAVVEAFARRSERLAPVAEELRALSAAGSLGRPLPDLAASYVHMQANRLLRSAHRAQELVLADLLDRLYTERIARKIPDA